SFRKWLFSLLLLQLSRQTPNTVSAADFTVDCGADSVTVTWHLGQKVNFILHPFALLLGNCVPLSFSKEEVVFHAGLNDCQFQHVVQGDKVIYLNSLTYRPDGVNPLFTYPVQCTYEMYVFKCYTLRFSFFGPALSKTFHLGSTIPIRASVVSQPNRPLQLYLDECIVTTSQDLNAETQGHPVITNAGCLVEGMYGESKFQPRTNFSELDLSLEAFGFALGEEVYLHCTLGAWEIQEAKVDKKACNYDIETGLWELLDDSTHSELCICCDSICHISNGVFFVGPLVLIIAMGSVALSYYLCIWRGGRLGYRPSRDLLNKY
uniref:ZP domain-containing protein n=1 Tax=Denticeps clupeoides TaxID=299321 RepID=A0AAY4CDH8_9TELE